MQAREPNVEGEGEVTQAELVRWALRMSPDRVLVGEIRGAEVIPMCNAMSQGNDGSMATLHASSSKGAFSRLATYAIQAPERLPLEATNLMVANAVDFVVHLGTDAQGRRVVSSVREVIDSRTPTSPPTRSSDPGPTAVPCRGARCGARRSTTWCTPDSTRSSSSATAGGNDDRLGCPPWWRASVWVWCSIFTGGAPPSSVPDVTPDTLELAP